MISEAATLDVLNHPDRASQLQEAGVPVKLQNMSWLLTLNETTSLLTQEREDVGIPLLNIDDTGFNNQIIAVQAISVAEALGVKVTPISMYTENHSPYNTKEQKHYLRTFVGENNLYEGPRRILSASGTEKAIIVIDAMQYLFANPWYCEGEDGVKVDETDFIDYLNWELHFPLFRDESIDPAHLRDVLKQQSLQTTDVTKLAAIFSLPEQEFLTGGKIGAGVIVDTLRRIRSLGKSVNSAYFNGGIQAYLLRQEFQNSQIVGISNAPDDMDVLDTFPGEIDVLHRFERDTVLAAFREMILK